MDNDLGIIERLFICWDLETWANVLEVLGFIGTVITLLYGIFINSKVNELKTKSLFLQTVNGHLKKLKDSTSKINGYLNDYDNNLINIRSEFAICHSEIEGLITKLPKANRKKSSELLKVLRVKKRSRFLPKKDDQLPKFKKLLIFLKLIHLTHYDEVWLVYDDLNEIIRQLEIQKINETKSI